MSIWRDNWIPSLVGRRLEHPGLIESQIPEKVADIIDKDNGEWKLDGIEQWLTEEQCRAIRIIPTNVRGGSDEVVWPYSKDGGYMVKSGYHKLKEEKVMVKDGPSSSHVVDGLARKLKWKLKVPSKI